MGKGNFHVALRASLLAAAALLPLGTAAAAAQPQQPLTNNANDPSAGTAAESTPAESDSTIVVTGTLIRNTAPTGTNPISVSTADIEATGATSSSEVLASIPQITGSFFNNIPQVGRANATALAGFNQTTSRPSLRPNPFGGTDTGNATLILIDGLRQAGIGVNGSSANPDSVPPALIQRVDVNPDGASSIYGSDAIGGVINFITRRKFDGVQVGGSVGLRSNYTAWDASIVAGKDWGSGGAYIGYAYSSNDLLLDREVDYYNPLDFATNLQRDLSCDAPNIQLAAGGGNPLRYYAVGAGGAPGSAPFTVVAPLIGTANVCTLGRDASLASANTRHHAMARFTQDLSDSVTVGIRARYLWEQQYGLTAPSTFSVTVNNTNPFWRAITGSSIAADNALTSYTIRGSLGAIQPEDKRRFQNNAEQYGVMGDLTWTFGKWRLLAIANFEWSNSSYSNTAINTAALTAGSNAAGSTCSLTPSAANCFNFYNIGASNSALISNLLNFYNIGEGSDQIVNFRAVLDGPVFELPGGEVKVAIGAEYLRDTFRKGIYTGNTPSALTQSEITQTDKALFGEINVPLFSESNAIPLFHALSFNASGRYDHYSDFGGTFNPRFGASWSPTPWATFRGNWGKSFRAPTTVDLLGTSAANTRLTSSPAAVFGGFLLRPGDAATTPATAVAVSLAGTKPGIQPQRGTNWSIGLDLTPLSGFKASVTYYRIFFEGLLGSPTNGTPIFPNLAFIATICSKDGSGLYGVNDPVCAAKRAEFIAAAGTSTIGNIATTDIYGYYDGRVTNLGNAKVSGIDWSIQYTHQMNWGTIYGSLSGAKLLSSESQALPGQAWVNNITPGNTTGEQSFGLSTHRISGRLGVNYHNFRGQLTWNHNSGYDLIPGATVLQDKVGAFDVFNLFFSYDFKGEGLTSGLKLSLNVDNIFNTSPPVYRVTNAGDGYINGSTLGRVFKLGFEKKF